MCEVFALNARRPTRANDELEVFFSHSITNPHGWGLSWRDESQVILHKEPLPASESEYIREVLSKDVSSRHIIGHIRNATTGARTYENCHPFVEEDATGSKWIIAHNGAVLNDNLLYGYEDRTEGDTDSEQVVLYLMDVLDEAEERAGGELDFSSKFDALASAVAHLSNGNKLNLVMDDGAATYAFTNTLDQTLFMRQREDECVFCTVPLDDSPEWEPVPRLSFLAVVDGHVIRRVSQFGVPFDDRILTQMNWDRGAGDAE